MPGTLVVGDVIDSARGEHPTFNNRRHPDPLLLKALSRYQKELLARIIRLDSSQAVQFFDQPLPLTDFGAGIAIPAYKYPFGVEVTDLRGKRHPIDLVPWESNTLYHHAAYLLNGILFLCGKVHDWVHVSNVRFLYVPEAAAIPLDAKSVLTLLPDGSESTLVAFLALQMAKRGGAADGEEKPNPAVFAGEWTQAEDRFFDEMARNRQAVVSQVRDTF